MGRESDDAERPFERQAENLFGREPQAAGRNQVVVARIREVGRVVSLGKGENGGVDVGGGNLSLSAVGKPCRGFGNGMKMQLPDEFAGTELKPQSLSGIAGLVAGRFAEISHSGADGRRCCCRAKRNQLRSFCEDPARRVGK
jgi:hypothetical protein